MGSTPAGRSIPRRKLMAGNRAKSAVLILRHDFTNYDDLCAACPDRHDGFKEEVTRR
jgi:hypothetical protein